MDQKAKGRNLIVEEPAAIYGSGPPARDRALQPDETVRRIRAGLPMAEFDALREMLGLSAEGLAGHLAIPRSTLARRRKAGHLDMQESDRLLRDARLFALARQVLPDDAAAREWLEAPARALGYVTPLEFAETEVGVREVENLLGRIDYGVFS